MSGLNKVMIIGNITRDIELRYSQQGTAVASFSVATNEKWTDKQGQKQEKAEFHRCISFGKQAEVLGQYLTKGSQVYLEGQLQTRGYDKDGQKQYTTEIVVRDFTFLGGGHGSGAKQANPEKYKSHIPKQAPQGQQPPEYYQPPNDDLPF